MIKQFYKQFWKYYKILAIIILNTIVVFFLLNIIIPISCQQEEQYKNLIIKMDSDTLKQIYPDFTREQITEMIINAEPRPFLYDSFTAWREYPYSGKYVRVDENGFRLVKNQGPWPPNREKYLTIFVFGGSTTFGYGLPDYQTIPSYIQEILFTLNMRKEPRVYNFGQGDYYSTKNLLFFEKLIIQGNIPDIAIFIDGLNEFFVDDGLIYRRQSTKTIPSHYLTCLLREIPLTKIALPLRTRLHKFLVKANDTKDTTKISQDNSHKNNTITKMINRYIVSKTMIDAISKHYHVHSMFVWQPISAYNYDLRYHLFADNIFKHSSRNLRLGYAEMYDLIQRSFLGKNFLWTADIQKGVEESLYVDRWHYTAKMSRMLAAYIVDSLKEHHLIEIVEGSESKVDKVMKFQPLNHTNIILFDQ